ncbi:MAG: hypothetical protein GOV00_01040 [Candidatus Altiarchaeota archaeon]|nr:hypothetical protein [Candidatus Altiarchaeota archaeon]
MINKGRVCMKIAGRDTGICAVVDQDKGKQRVQVIGPEVRKRWISPTHLEPLSKELDSKLSEAKMMKALEKINEEVKQVQVEPIDVLAIKAKSRR